MRTNTYQSPDSFQLDENDNVNDTLIDTTEPPKIDVRTLDYSNLAKAIEAGFKIYLCRQKEEYTHEDYVTELDNLEPLEEMLDRVDEDVSTRFNTIWTMLIIFSSTAFRSDETELSTSFFLS